MPGLGHPCTRNGSGTGGASGRARARTCDPRLRRRVVALGHGLSHTVIAVRIERPSTSRTEATVRALSRPPVVSCLGGFLGACLGSRWGAERAKAEEKDSRSPRMRTPHARNRELLAFAVSPLIVPFVYLLPFPGKT